MSKELTRYIPSNDWRLGVFMLENEGGSYVLFSEHERELADYKECLATIDVERQEHFAFAAQAARITDGLRAELAGAKVALMDAEKREARLLFRLQNIQRAVELAFSEGGVKS